MASLSKSNWLTRLRLYVSIVRYSNTHNQDFANEHYASFVSMQRRLRDYGVTDLKGRRVLDVGCGKSYWLTLLFHSLGAKTTGIDTEFVGTGRSLGKYWRLLQTNGLDRTLRTSIWDLFYGPPYYRALENACGFPLHFEGVDARALSVTDLDFPDDTFDLVVSHEVFEHLPDLPAAVETLRRVMKPNGLTYIYIHNFASVSGGHHLSWKYPA